VEENSGKRKGATQMDIMEPSPNASTEQKQLASSYQGLIRQQVQRRKVKIFIVSGIKLISIHP